MAAKVDELKTPPLSVTVTAGNALVTVNVVLAVVLKKSVLPAKLTNTVYVPGDVGAPPSAVPEALVPE